MLKTLIYFLILVMVIESRAQVSVAEFYAEPEKTETRFIFNPLVSISARTLPPGSVAFQKSGAANVNSSMLANALSVGILPRFEMGMVPMFYISAPGSFNFTGKASLYKGHEFDTAISYSQIKFKSEIKEEGQIVETPDLVLRSYQLVWTYHPENQNYIVSPFASNVCGYIDSEESTRFARSLKCDIEWGIDYQWRFKDREWLTFAYGHLREAGISPYETMQTGVGVAWSQYRPSEILSRPSLGVYMTPKTGELLYLVSTTFFEH